MNELKNMDFEIVNKKKFTINDFFECFRENIYSLLFYTFGLILGSYFYIVSSNDAIDKLLTANPENIYIEIISNIILYLSIWLILLLMGFSLIGFSVMNIIPFSAGVYYGLKAACYYTLYSGKGIGYAALAIAPVASLLLVLVLYTISYQARLSKSIYTVIKDKTKSFTLTVKPLIIHIIIQLVLFITLSLVNSLLSTGIRNIISI